MKKEPAQPPALIFCVSILSDIIEEIELYISYNYGQPYVKVL